jgi:hypothetical protein
MLSIKSWMDDENVLYFIQYIMLKYNYTDYQSLLYWCIFFKFYVLYTTHSNSCSYLQIWCLKAGSINKFSQTLLITQYLYVWLWWSKLLNFVVEMNTFYWNNSKLRNTLQCVLLNTVIGKYWDHSFVEPDLKHRISI